MKRVPTDKLCSLTDFDVRQVHLVDLAANKRRFLIAKRRDPVPEAETKTEPAVDDNAAPAPDADETPPPVQEPHASGKSAGDTTQTALVEVLSALQATLQHLKAPPVGAPAPVPSSNENAPVGETAEVIKGLTQRLVRLEKAFPLPNSESPEGQGRKGKEHVWPFDINRPLSDDDADSRGGRGG